MKTRTARRRIPASKKEETVADFASSGLSRREYAETRGIAYSTLCGWLHDASDVKSSTRPSSAAKFVEVVAKSSPSRTPAPAASSSRAFVIHLSDGVSVDFFSGYETADVCRILRAAKEVCS